MTNKEWLDKKYFDVKRGEVNGIKYCYAYIGELVYRVKDDPSDSEGFPSIDDDTNIAYIITHWEKVK